jgi:hypothetical protein
VNVLVARKKILGLAYDENDNKLDMIKANIMVANNRLSALRNILHSRKFLNASVYVLADTNRKKKSRHSDRINHSLNETTFIKELLLKA